MKNTNKNYFFACAIFKGQHLATRGGKKLTISQISLTMIPILPPAAAAAPRRYNVGARHPGATHNVLYDDDGISHDNGFDNGREPRSKGSRLIHENIDTLSSGEESLLFSD